MRKAISALVAALATLTPAAALAEGTETLGSAQLQIEQGSGILSAGTGTGTESGSGTISLDVPSEAVVRQAILYWEGEHRGATGDDTVTVNGNPVSGTLIGGPAFFFAYGGDVFTSSYRADITDLGLVEPGSNNLLIDDMDFDFANAGAGILVIVDDGSDIADIQVRDGIDNAYEGFPNERKVTVPQVFTVAAAPVDRVADLALMVGSVAAPDRPSHVLVTVDGTPTTYDILASNEGAQWDAPSIPVTIPAGATTVTVELVSADDDDGVVEQPASLEWVMAALSVGTCPVVSQEPAITHGSAYAVDGQVLLLDIHELGAVETVAPGAPGDDALTALSANVAGLLTANFGSTQSHSEIGLSPTSTASATVAGVSVLGGLVRADVIRGVSQSVASTTSATYSSAGSVITGLRIGGNNIANPAPNTKVDLRAGIGLIQVKVGEVFVYEETGTSSFSDGVASASHSVNMVRIKLVRNYLGLPTGTEIILGHAQTDASGPARPPCVGLQSVSGRAFTAYADGDVLGNQLVAVQVGDANLPPTGGADSDNVPVALGPVATSNTGSNSTSGSLDPDPNATAQSQVEGLNLLNGLITADLLNVTSTSTADGTNASTSFNFTLANLQVGGTTVAANVGPNTVMTLNLPGGGFVQVILNEQVRSSNGTSDTEGTINAIHVFVFGPGGLFSGEVIVASAHSDAHA